jgi:hypothetical protein
MLGFSWAINKALTVEIVHFKIMLKMLNGGGSTKYRIQLKNVNAPHYKREYN